jgi:hypothetical protein
MVLQTVSAHSPEWLLTWRDFLNNHVNFRSCPSYVRVLGRRTVAAADGHGQRPYKQLDLAENFIRAGERHEVRRPQVWGFVALVQPGSATAW